MNNEAPEKVLATVPNSRDPDINADRINQQLLKKFEKALKVFLKSFDYIFKYSEKDVYADFTMRYLW